MALRSRLLTLGPAKQDLRRACRRTPPVMCVEALRWFAKHAQVEGLAAAMYMPIISAYTLRRTA